MSNFKYSAEEINKMINENRCQKVAMYGMRRDLEKLKPIIEKIYDENIFYISYWKDDCPFHGWEWSKDDGTMANMAKITDGIKYKFKEIYSLILAGLGEKCQKEDD